jgi:pyridoxal phosphate enzyme (YggS family)
VAHNLAEVRARIADAARRAAHDPASVTLVAVSKTVSLDRLCGIEGAGITDLGENRVQEATEKIEALGAAFRWHLIGHLQRNKARRAVELFDLIHSVDSLELAAALNRHAQSLGKRQRVLLQVNVSGEESKGGFSPDGVREAAAQLAGMLSLQPEGLMTIAPLGVDERRLRGVFGALRGLHGELAPCFDRLTWRHLSMGMTDDFEVAIEEGATLVRIGRALFGERPPAAAPR